MSVYEIVEIIFLKIFFRFKCGRREMGVLKEPADWLLFVFLLFFFLLILFNQEA